MNKHQIQLLQKLDTEGMDGNIQSILQNKNIDKLQFQEVILWLLKVNMDQKRFLEKENKKFSKVLKENDLYTNELIFGEDI